MSKLTYAAVLFGTLAAVAPALAHPPHSLSPLRKYAGKYAVNSVLANPEVRRELTAMAGPKAKKFYKYMKVITPIDLIDGDLVPQGGYPHQVPEMCAAVLVSFRENRVYAALFDNGQLDVYGRGRSEESLPRGLRTWIDSAKSSYIDGPVHTHFH